MENMLCILLLEPVIPIWLIVVCGIVFFYRACSGSGRHR